MPSQYAVVPGDIGPPNLDCMDADDLHAFWVSSGGRTRTPLEKARELFPSRRSGYVKVTSSLGDYAMNRATAMRCRLRGEIGEALKYEQICDRIHLWLPMWARW